MARRKATPSDEVRAFQVTFLAPNGDVPDACRLVLGALLRYTGGVQSPTQYDATGKVDTEATLIAIGRADVWRFITEKLNLSDATIYTIAKDALRIPAGDDDHG